MLTKKFFKFSRSFIKLILPLLYRIFQTLRVNRRVINFLEERSFNSNNVYDFSPSIQKLLSGTKIIAIDVGAQGGFNSDNFFPKKYNNFFEDILVEPIETEAKKLKTDKFIINKGLWSKKETKKLYILKNRLGSSSMYEPDEKNFDLHNINESEKLNFKVTDTINIECDTLENILLNKNIKKLDYLKIDTQGAELEILKGLGIFTPIVIKLEIQIHSMYKDVPSWHKLLNVLYDLDYVVIDWKKIGKHSTRVPAEMDMLLIPNFNSDQGKNKIINNQRKFISLMLIFGQINLLKILLKRLNIKFEDIEKIQDLYFN